MILVGGYVSDGGGVGHGYSQTVTSSYVGDVASVRYLPYLADIWPSIKPGSHVQLRGECGLFFGCCLLGRMSVFYLMQCRFGTDLLDSKFFRPFSP